ncbi:MAG: hypothetical protein P8I82_02435 [Flavobacteriales bacterium]|nr:hypothetical protein [Flavobacteriales bacterium]
MNLPLDDINKYPVFYRFYKNAKILGAELTLREHSKELDGMIVCPGFFFKPTIIGVNADIINKKNEK